MDAQEIESLKRMSSGEFRIWLAGKFELVDMRLCKLEKRRWPWMLAGGGVTGVGVALTVVLRVLSVV